MIIAVINIIIVITGTTTVLSIQRGFSLLRDSILALTLIPTSAPPHRAHVTHVYPKHSETMKNYQKHKWKTLNHITESEIHKIPFRHISFPLSDFFSLARPWAWSGLTGCLPTPHIPWLFSCPSIVLGASTASTLFQADQVFTCPSSWLYFTLPIQQQRKGLELQETRFKDKNLSSFFSCIIIFISNLTLLITQPHSDCFILSFTLFLKVLTSKTLFFNPIPSTAPDLYGIQVLPAYVFNHQSFNRLPFSPNGNYLIWKFSEGY